MKVLVFADPHLNNWKRFGVDKEVGMSRRLEEQQKCLEQISEICRKETVELVICAGDLFHKVGEIPVECLNVASRFYSGLRKDGVSFINVQGNHDIVNRTDPKWFQSAVGIFNSMSMPAVLSSIKIVNWQDKIDYDEIKGYNLVVLHKEPQGAKIGSFTFEGDVDWRRLQENNGLVLFGHIHQMQQLGGRAWVIGSMMHLTFGDEGARGVFVVDTDKKEATFIALESPQFITVDTEDQVKDSFNYYRVLSSKEKSDKENVVSVVVPEYFTERIKAETFREIIGEWLKIQNKDLTYLDCVKDILKDKVQIDRKFFNGRLLRVEIKDFISVGYIAYDIKNSFVLVVGNSDMFDSNGSGKSTVFGEAIYWALFGETTKGLTGDDIVRRTKSDCLVSVTLEDGGDRFIVDRSRKDGLRVSKANKNGDRIRELTEGLRQVDRQKVLDEILGFDKKVFRAACYFSQENLLMMTGLTDSEKTDMVTDLLGFEVYDDMYKEVSKKASEVQIEVDNLDVKERHTLAVNLERVKAIKSGHDRALTDVDSSIGEYSGKIGSIEKGIVEAKKKLDAVVDKGVDLSESDEVLNSLSDMDKKLSESIVKIDGEVSKKRVDEATLIRSGASIESEVDRCAEDRAKLTREIERLQRLSFGERCDKCGALITKENAEDFIKEKQKSLDEIKKIEIEKDKKRVELEEKLTLIKTEIADLNKKKDGLNKKVSGIKIEVREEMGRRAKLEEESRRVAGIRKELEKEVSMLTSRLQEVKSELGRLEEKKKRIKADVSGCADELIEIETKLKSVDIQIGKMREDLLKYDFWKMSFSAKGVRSLLLDRFCNQFNVIVNRYLSTISNGEMSIVVSPTKQLKSGEERNKIGLDIRIGSTDVKYESLSGGEKRRVDVSLCLGLNRWVTHKYDLKSGVLGLLILDEVFSYVDRVGEESIGSLLHEEGQTKAVFVISHTPELASYAKDIYMVVKEKGISSLETGFIKNG